jgi:two-component system NtrC family sensor kinase
LPSLFVIRGNDQGARYELDADIVTIGREASNTIQLHDQEVSRFHADLRRQGNTFVLTDLSSSNGSYVNSNRVKSHVLSSGDQVQLGRTLMLYTGSSDESSINLDDKVHILAQDAVGDNSRIVRSMTHQEGSQILRLEPSAAQDSPWLAQARSHLEVMYRTALAVSHTLDIDQLLNRILQLIFEWVDADRGCIMLVDPDTRRLEPKAHLSRREPSGDGRLTISQTILDYVVQHNQGVLTTNAQEDTRWNPAASIVQMGIREAMCVPMQGRYHVVGVIYIDTTTSPQKWLASAGRGARFSEEHLKLMIAIAHQAALAVEDTRYYSAMLQAERLAAIGQTIAMLSHHIKNVLQGISAGSFLIKDGLARQDAEMIRKGWQFVEKNQQRISNLVMDMLTFSKEREPEMQQAHLNQVLGDVVELMQSRAAEMGIQLVWHPDPAMPTLTFDPEGIHRAALNIVTNALDACSDRTDGRVVVSTQYDEPQRIARVHIEDNGPGIPPEKLPKIFSLFVSEKRSRGTGLGLPVSQKILQEHGGRILVDSAVGRGSRFTLELPAILPARTADDEVPRDSGTLGGT